MNDTVTTKLKDIVGAKGFSEDPTEIAPHLTEWRGKYQGRSALLLKPATTAEVSAILAFCNQTRTAVVPQGGNTGLVGGQIPFAGEVLLSLQRLNRIRKVDADGGSITAEAGVLLAEVQHAAEAAAMMFPLSLAAEGTCTIGGNLSSNAGGVNVLRYGMARDLTLGIEAVLADGRVLDCLRTLRKDNTGYDLKQLFIGAEGTLGIVTAAALKLFPKPHTQCTAFLAVPDVRSAVALLKRVQGATGGLMNAFELVPRFGLELVLRHMPGARDPFAGPSPWYVLAEASGPRFVKEAFEEALSSALEDGLASDAVMAASEAQRAGLWALREGFSEAQKHAGASIKHDISVPVSALPDFIDKATAVVVALVPGVRPVTFGHLGDGNLHFNFTAPEGEGGDAFLARWDEIARQVHDVVGAFGGSISAEHGIGVMKRAELGRTKSTNELDVMRALKRSLDPNNILNPGKLLPD